MVFRCRTDHCRPADIDQFDQSFSFFRAIRRGERIEVHDHEVEQFDPEAQQFLLLFRIPAFRKQPSMHARVQCLDAPAQDFRMACDIRHLLHSDAGFAQRNCGSA